MDKALEIIDVTKKYENITALNDVSLVVESGEVVAILGPNGAGKSTLMKLISGYMIPDYGIIKVKGLDMKEKLLRVQKKIGYMPESNPLYQHLTVLESINHFLNLHSIFGKRRKKLLEYAIESTGLQNHTKKIISSLSKGYKQRVGLAQVLAVDPEILLLDEPTEGLDPIQRIEIRNVIKDIGKKRTVLISTHVMQEVDAMCSRIIILSNGKVLLDKSIKSVKTILSKRGINLEKLFCDTVMSSYEKINN
jgi:ABC-2 type transport system ATP-binding protein